MLWTRKNYGTPGYEMTGAGAAVSSVGIILVSLPLGWFVWYMPTWALMLSAGTAGLLLLGGCLVSYLRKMRALRVELVRDQINRSTAR